MALTKVTGSVIKDSVSLSGNVSVGGTLTYQDVTNVDALGIGTFRTGIKVLAGQVDVGNNIKLGNAGVITATSFVGNIGGTPTFSGDITIPDKIVHAGDTNTAIRFPSADTVTIETGGAQRFRVDSNGTTHTTQVNSVIGAIIKNTAHDSQLQILATYANKNSVIFFGDAADADVGQIDYDHNDNSLAFVVNTSEALRIDSSGRLLLGQTSSYTVSPAGGTIIGVFTREQSNRSDFVLSNQSSANNAGAALVLASHGQDYIIESTGSGNSSDGAGSLTFSKSGSERFRIDSAGRFLKGLTSAGGSRSSTSVRYPHFQLSSPWSSGLGSYKIECTDDYPIIFIDSNASYADGTGAGVITWSVKDSSGDYCNTASVRSKINGTPSNDSAPGSLEFMTTTSGSTPTTKMTISSQGYVTKPNHPSFSVYISTTHNAASQNTGTQTMPFDSANSNIGSHFKTSGSDQYKFVAPVAGNYYFSLSQNHSARVDSRILKNGSSFHGGESEEIQSAWDHHHLSCVMPLAAGDKVHCTTNNQDGGAKRCWNGGYWDNFSGFLIG